MPAFPIKIARPADAVGRGRIGYNLSADRLLLHTIQTEEAIEGLLSAGVLVVWSRSMPTPTVGCTGRWRRGCPTTGNGAVWFWAQIRRQDLVELCGNSPGKVLLARVRAAGVAPDAEYRHWPEELRTELEMSWEFILDPGNYGRYESWQATMHCLYEDDVVEAVRLQR